MNLSKLDQHVLSYYLSHAARDLSIAGRFYPYGDLVASIADKVRLKTRKFGNPVSSRAVPVAKAFLEIMISRGAFSTVPQKIGHPMHQFQEKTYRQVLKELEEGDAIIQSARQSGDEFWMDAFQALTENPVE